MGDCDRDGDGVHYAALSYASFVHPWRSFWPLCDHCLDYMYRLKVSRDNQTAVNATDIEPHRGLRSPLFAPFAPSLSRIAKLTWHCHWHWHEFIDDLNAAINSL